MRSRLLQFIVAPFNEDALSATSVSDLFNIARRAPPFSTKGLAYWKRLRDTYKELCNYSHSSSLSHMGGIHALSHFPALNVADFNSWTKHANACTSSMCSTLLLCNRNLYLKAHFRTKEVIDLLISSQLKLQLLSSK
jgi:hypothetical protein